MSGFSNTTFEDVASLAAVTGSVATPLGSPVVTLIILSPIWKEPGTPSNPAVLFPPRVISVTRSSG